MTKWASFGRDVAAYVAELARALDGLTNQDLSGIGDLLHSARVERRSVFLFGNGGSASTASHMTCDLIMNSSRSDLPDIRAVCLNDNTPLLTALANDEGYDLVFVRQLESLADPEDLVVAISTSGQSPNVLAAVEWHKERGGRSVGLTGGDGGLLGSLVDKVVMANSPYIEIQEDVHLAVGHILSSMLREA